VRKIIFITTIFHKQQTHFLLHSSSLLFYISTPVLSAFIAHASAEPSRNLVREWQVHASALPHLLFVLAVF